MASEKHDLPESKAEISREARSSETWKKNLEKLSRQTLETRRHLVERVARDRAFQHLDEEIGKKPEDFTKVFDRVTASYLDGTFFLRHLGLFYEVSPSLSLLVYDLRQEWIQQYDLRTIPELLLLDQAMLAYFHVLRINREISSMLSLIEVELYYTDAPHVKIRQRDHLTNEFDGFVASDEIKKLQERLMPLIERFNLMFLRNLRVMRELKTHPISINIGQAGQVNVGQQQVNVQKGQGKNAEDD